MIAGRSRVKGNRKSARHAVNRAKRADSVVYAYAVYPAVAAVAGVLDNDGVMPGVPVRAETLGDMTVVLSDVEAGQFGADAIKEHLKDADWARDRVLGHHRVLTGLPFEGMLPFKFCTLFSSLNAVADELTRRRPLILEAAEGIAGAREYGVKLYADADTLYRRTQSTVPELNGIARRLSAASRGTAFFLRRKLREMTLAAAQRSAGDGARSSHETLETAARRASVQPVQPRDAHGQGKEMLLNAAYLVPVDEVGGFHGEVDALQGRYEPLGFSYALTGPWPPYTFAALGPDDGRI